MGVNVVDVDELMLMLMLMVVIKNQISYDFINKQRTLIHVHTFHLPFEKVSFSLSPSICTRMV